MVAKRIIEVAVEPTEVNKMSEPEKKITKTILGKMAAGEKLEDKIVKLSDGVCCYPIPVGRKASYIVSIEITETDA